MEAKCVQTKVPRETAKQHAVSEASELGHQLPEGMAQARKVPEEQGIPRKRNHVAQRRKYEEAILLGVVQFGNATSTYVPFLHKD